MKDRVDLVINEDGSIDAIYQDGLAEVLGAKTKEVRRASNVEWEETKDGEGWTVRSALDPEVAIRIVLENATYHKVVGRKGDLAVYPKREDALADEVDFFWDIVSEKPPRELICPRCHTEFADPDPKKDYPAGIICPVCSDNNKRSGVTGLVGVIHPK